LGIALSALNVKRQSKIQNLLLLFCTTQKYGSGDGASTYLKRKRKSFS